MEFWPRSWREGQGKSLAWLGLNSATSKAIDLVTLAKTLRQ